MIPDIDADDAESLINTMCETLGQAGCVDNSEKLVDAVMEREAIMSTAVAQGVAFPHVRGIEGGGLTLAVGTSKKGIDFGGPGRGKTRIFFFMIIPTAASSFYLKLLSGLSRVYQEKDARDQLIEANDQQEMWETLLKTTKGVIS